MVEHVETKNLMQTSTQFCKVFGLRFVSFSLSTNCSALYVGRSSNLILYHPTKRSLYFAYLRV